VRLTALTFASPPAPVMNTSGYGLGVVAKACGNISSTQASRGKRQSSPSGQNHIRHVPRPLLGLEESRQDVATIKAWPFLHTQTKVDGYAFDVETGRVRKGFGCENSADFDAGTG
jgi:hypothetical protein